MCLLFASIYFADKWLETSKPWFLLGVFAAFFPALLAKENAFTFLAVIPLTLWFFRKPALKPLLISFLPLLLSALVYAALRLNALGMEANTVVVTELLNDPFLNTSTSERYATVFYTWLIYLKLLVFPHPLTHDYYPYHIAITNFGDLRVWLSLGIYAFLLFFALKNIRRNSLMAYGILLYGIVFSISSNLLFNIGAFMNERFIFISILGFTLILAWLLHEKMKSRALSLTLLLIILCSFSLKTITRNYAWKDDFTLFTTDVKVSKNSAKVNVSAGGMLIEKAQKEPNKTKRKAYLSQAITYLRKGLEIHSRYTAGWVLLGNAYFELRELPSAYTCYDNAIKTGPANKDAVTNMGILLNFAAAKMDYTTSENASRWLLARYPDSLVYHYELAAALLGNNKVDTSLLMLEEVLKTDPQHYMAWCKLGELYGRYLNRIDVSEEYLLKSAAINPSWLPAQENLGIVYAMKGQLQRSKEYFLKALELDEKQSRIHRNISLTYKQMGDTLNAGIHLRRALELEKEAE
jgi:protein O-mannosyl-transferase